MSQDRLYLNGIDASTGTYWQPPLTPAEAAGAALAEALPPEHVHDLLEKGGAPEPAQLRPRR